MPEFDNLNIFIREIQPSDGPWVRAFLLDQARSAQVVTRGIIHNADELPGFIGLYEGEPRGLLTYSHSNNDLEVVTLHAAVRGVGLGSRLLRAAKQRAYDLGCRRMWLITTNDNEPAISFYKKEGMHIAAIHRGAIAESRKLKPQIGYFGVGGRAIEDEIELQILLTEYGQ
ncbi:MAG: GNAT family N-acetyltransferase [Acidobacteriaceae bacterium]|nr:GNAT family N-acetyltransferase [Acidobacteriaceae bacterium]